MLTNMLFVKLYCIHCRFHGLQWIMFCIIGGVARYKITGV